MENLTENLREHTNQANSSLSVITPSAQQSAASMAGMHDENHDHFIERNGIKYAGTHLIVDLWGADNISNLKIVEHTLREAVIACNASLLSIHLHHFTPNNGISGIAVLAESHISIHTWPERKYAALDIFMCGDSKPENAIAVLKKAFTPDTVCINQQMRGALYE